MTRLRILNKYKQGIKMLVGTNPPGSQLAVSECYYRSSNEPEAEDQEKTYKLPDSIPLDIPCGNFKELDIHLIDIYSCDSFKKRIQEQQKQCLPYFLAVGKTETGTTIPFDGISSILGRINYNQDFDPATRSKIDGIWIYQLDNYIQNNPCPKFRFLTTLSTIRANHEHFLKLMNAVDPDLNKKIRGQERLYMGVAYSVGNGVVEKDIEKADFWFQKSLEDGCDEAAPLFVHSCLMEILQQKLAIGDVSQKMQCVKQRLPLNSQTALANSLSVLQSVYDSNPFLYQNFSS